MDSLPTVPGFVVFVAVKWRQENQGQPNRPVVVVTVLFHLRQPAFSIARRERPHELAHLPQLLTFIFFAQEEARRAHLLRVPLSWRAARTTVDDVVNEMPNLRCNMVSYEARFPAAVDVRNNLGDEIWDKIESYRCTVAYLAFSAARHQRTAAIAFPAPLRTLLDHCLPHIQAYIRASWGEDDLEIFQCIHESLEDDIGILQGWPITRLFCRQPVFWLFYNFFIPVERRMSWDELSEWAIEHLLGGNSEPPALPLGIQGMDVWNSNPAATAIWNAAVIEVFADIQQQFR